MTTPIFIFDIDGTLADTRHRLPILLLEQTEGKWDRFYELCDRDPPIRGVIAVLDRLVASGADIKFFTGRSELVRRKTITWLLQHTITPIRMLEPEHLKMRLIGDHREASTLKSRWYDQLSEAEKRAVVAVFEDHNQVVSGWRARGLTCLQPAPGPF